MWLLAGLWISVSLWVVFGPSSSWLRDSGLAKFLLPVISLAADCGRLSVRTRCPLDRQRYGVNAAHIAPSAASLVGDTFGFWNYDAWNV